MSQYEEEIVARHSTPGLRKGQLSRTAKKDHLNAAYNGNKYPADRDAVLDKLYPEEKS